MSDVKAESFENVVPMTRGPRKARARAANATAANDQAGTIIVGTDLHRVVDDACAALGAAENIFQRDGELVRVVRAAEPDERCGVVAGTPQIKSVALPTLKEELSRVRAWGRISQTRSGERFTACLPSSDVVTAVAARGHWPAVRPLVGVIDHPAMRPDGTIISVAGYDVRTGLIYEPSCDVPPVAEQPSQSDAAAALARICEVFADFPFASEPARYVPSAALLTLVARPAIKGGTPLITIESSMRSSGKSKAADCVSIIATGRSAPRMTYPKDESELEKMLCSCALFGSRLVCLDNIASTLGAAPLDKVLTAEDRVSFRILGRSEVKEPRWTAVLMATGNNLVLGADTASRTLMCRLEPEVERPEERTGFRHSDLLGFVHANRGPLLHDALTILRAFVVAGRPGTGVRIGVGGRFIGWTDLVAAAISYAGGANVLEASAVTLGSPDPDAEALRTILGSLGSLVPDGATARTIVGLLYPTIERGSRRPPDGWDALRDAIEILAPPKRPGDPPTAAAIGTALRSKKGQIIGGKRLESFLDRTNVQAWRVR